MFDIEPADEPTIIFQFPRGLTQGLRAADELRGIGPFNSLED